MSSPATPTTTLVALPCTAAELETALHAHCDFHGAWQARIDTICTGHDSGDAAVCLILSRSSSETAAANNNQQEKTK